MRLPLLITSAAEAATGLGLVLIPTLVLRLLFGTPTEVDQVIVARICGVALLALSLACWPRSALTSGFGQQRAAMFVYNGATGILLTFFGVKSATTGPLLWPAAILHFAMFGWLAGSGPTERASGS